MKEKNSENKERIVKIKIQVSTFLFVRDRAEKG